MFSFHELSEGEADDPIGGLSMEEAMNLYEPMIRDFMDQELYIIDMDQDLNARGMQILLMKKHLMRLQFKIMYEADISMEWDIVRRWESCKTSIERCQVTSRWVLVDGHPLS